ncbi:unnamed protein product [Boreogadus saida]
MGAHVQVHRKLHKGAQRPPDYSKSTLFSYPWPPCLLPLVSYPWSPTPSLMVSNPWCLTPGPLISYSWYPTHLIR